MGLNRHWESQIAYSRNCSRYGEDSHKGLLPNGWCGSDKGASRLELLHADL